MPLVYKKLWHSKMDNALFVLKIVFWRKLKNEAFSKKLFFLGAFIDILVFPNKLYLFFSNCQTSFKVVSGLTLSTCLKEHLEGWF